MSRIWKTTVAEAEFEPHPGEGVEMVEGEFDALLHVVREGAVGEGMLQVGICDMEPCIAKYVFEGDETIFIPKGNLRIELEDGESVELRAGDFASFPKGVLSTWTIREPTRELFILSG